MVVAFSGAFAAVTKRSAENPHALSSVLDEIGLPRAAPLPVPMLAARRFYRPELDALRLLAFLMVWTSHSLPSANELSMRSISPAAAWWLQAIKDAGNFGVCIFFFLSAYLITELLRRERVATGTVHLRAFYLRRILRIWPLYLGVLAVYGLLGVRFHGFRIEPGRLVASLLLAGNWYIALHPAILTPMRALWSLSVEEQFYLGWPVLARASRPSSLAVVCIGLVALGQGVLVWLARHSSQPAMLHVTAWVNSLVQFQYFALGGLAALLLRGRTPAISALSRATLATLSGAIMLLAAGLCQVKRSLPAHTSASLTSGYALAGLGCVLLFFAVLGTGARRIPRWAAKLGQVSFGLYVFHETGFFLANALMRRLVAHPSALASAWLAVSQAHWQLALAANKLVSLGITVVLALLSYHLWERPFLRLKERFTFARSRPA